jgi:hypothetical protein
MLSTIYLIGVFIVIGFGGWCIWRRENDPVFDSTNKPEGLAREFGVWITLVALLWPVLLIILVLGIIALVIYLSWYARDEEDD